MFRRALRKGIDKFERRGPRWAGSGPLPPHRLNLEP